MNFVIVSVVSVPVDLSRIMVKEQLIEKSAELFLRYGIRSVSMDDIARELGMSKKTLYQQVENKSDLIRKIFTIKSAEERAAVQEMREGSRGAIEEMVLVLRYMISRLRLSTPPFRYDLEKYYQDIYLELSKLHMTFFVQFIQDNLKRGMKEQLYRTNLKEEVVAKLFVSMAIKLGHNEFFAIREYRLEDLVEQLFSYHIHGIASPRGLEVIANYLEHGEKEKF